MTRRPLALAAVLLLAACGSGSGGSDVEENGSVAATGSGASQSAALDMNDDLAFVPNVVTAEVGTLALTAANVGKVPHNLVFDDGSLPSTETVAGGKSQTLTVVFSKAGTYRFTCTFHPGMDGKVVVAAAGQR
jgi:plastocyanin